MSRWQIACVGLISAIALGACDDRNPAPRPDSAEGTKIADIPGYVPKKPASAKAPDAPRKVKAAVAADTFDGTGTDADFDLGEIPEPPVDHASVCWVDYCPCDTSDPDYGFLDVSLCRDIKGGVHVDDRMMSIAARGRDGRREARRWKEQNPDLAGY